MALTKSDAPQNSGADKAPEEGTSGKQPDSIAADVPNSIPDEFQTLAEDMKDGPDDDQKVSKEMLLADSPQEEVAKKVEKVKSDASPDNQDTPSGRALLEVAGESNDTERGEKYARAKTAARWGYVPADSDSDK